MLGGGRGLRYDKKSNDKSSYTELTRLYPLSTLKFRARLDTSDGIDVHREFSGAYMPRFRSLYINEIKDTQKLGMKGVSLVPFVQEDVHLKSDGDYFYTDDFEIGMKLSLGPGKAPKDLQARKTFVITDVDKTELKYTTTTSKQPAKNKEGPMEIVLEKLRAAIRKRNNGKISLKAIGRHFKNVDRNGDRTLDRDEFDRVLDHCGLSADLSETDINTLITVFDKDKNGLISFNEFLEGVRGPMSEHRSMCVAAAFKKIDYNQDGILTLEDVRQFYCPKYHPKVLSGEASPDEILAKFLDRFDTKVKDGVVSYPEFSDYYSGVSANIDDDDHFIFMMERAWNLDNRNETNTPFR
eukprot:TRINITY_DN7414_c0_g2_i1.p1 TRINITY_DN7414_c0_g2~~TRINITY_DN7414_c0_g2_i1.p1  ORF type:complete len:360 (+),score=86.02 TRINITY_DN7414_c0_g2_i1:23-1081(+)